jgi:hypothetical protein
MTLAPTLISFSLSVVSDQSFDSSGKTGAEPCFTGRVDPPVVWAKLRAPMAAWGHPAPSVLSSNESAYPHIAAATRAFSRFGFAPCPDGAPGLGLTFTLDHFCGVNHFRGRFWTLPRAGLGHPSSQQSKTRFRKEDHQNPACIPGRGIPAQRLQNRASQTRPKQYLAFRPFQASDKRLGVRLSCHLSPALRRAS